jgi:NAD(P)-dependent dehydrogenase (short-subunit alcohol dehydrogenase family)
MPQLVETHPAIKYPLFVDPSALSKDRNMTPTTSQPSRAIVTGASRGIGKAISIALADRGYAVACVARSSDANANALPGTVEETVRLIEARGGQAAAILADLSDENEAARAVSASVDAIGGVDLLVNNAAVAFRGGLDLAPRKWAVMLAINLRAPWVTTNAAMPIMQDQGAGRIINVSSIVATTSFPGLAAYGISKLALERLTVETAAELNNTGISVNALRIDVGIRSEGIMRSAPRRSYDGWEPPETAADAVCWLAKQPETFTGQVVTMDALLSNGFVPMRAQGLRSVNLA